MGFLSDYKEFPVGLPIAGTAIDPDSRGYVYVIGFDEAGIVKIGSAASVCSRISQLQTSTPFELKLLAAVSIYDVNPILVEVAAHRIAKEMGAHIRGEWFELETDDALRCVIEAAKSKRAKYGSWVKAIKKANQAVGNDNTSIEEERRAKLRVKLGMA